jgi:hypothetical protein
MCEQTRRRRRRRRQTSFSSLAAAAHFRYYFLCVEIVEGLLIYVHLRRIGKKDGGGLEPTAFIPSCKKL